MKKMLSIVASTAVALTALAQQAPIAVRWEMGPNGAEKGYYSSRFVIKNVSRLKRIGNSISTSFRVV